MYKRIKELYRDKKYKLATFYILKKGIHYINELYSFDFDELKTVPGIDNSIIMEMKEILKSNLMKDYPFEESEYTFNTLDLNNKVSVINNISSNSILNKSPNLLKDANIIDIYNKVPRSTPFVNYCLKKGKVLISQLMDTDFEEAINTRGISKESASRMYEIYKTYIENNSIEELNFNLMDAGLEKLPIERILGNSEKEKAFITHCHEIGINNLLELNNINIAAAKLNGVETLYIEDIFRKMITDAAIYSDTYSQISLLEEIPIENANLSINYIKKAGISDAEICLLKDNGINTLNDICNSSLPIDIIQILLKARKYIKKPYTAIFINTFDGLRDINKECLIQRTKGYTLEKIGGDVGLSRERVRQITSDSCDQLMEGAELIAEVLMLNNESCFYFNELQSVFKNEIQADCCKFVLRYSNKYKYLDFDHKFISH